MADEDAPERVEVTAPAALATVSVKLPPFWPSDLEVRFAQVEAYFTTRRITAQRTRFDHVVTSLSPEVAIEIRDLILRLPADQPYKVLREQLIKCTAASEQWRLQPLFHAEELGDRKKNSLSPVKSSNICWIWASFLEQLVTSTSHGT